MPGARPRSSASSRRHSGSSSPRRPRSRRTNGTPIPPERTISVAIAVAIVVGLAAFVVVALIGGRIARGEPLAVDRAGARFRGRGVEPARVFTALGYWPGITGVAVLAVAASRAQGVYPPYVGAVIVGHVLGQCVVAIVKLRYRRARPEDGLGRRERDTSYPSGHSATGATFYLPLAALVAQAAPHAPYPLLDVVTAVILGACVIGLPWSRLVLAAHFASDVVGGFTFGVGWSALGIAIAAAVVP